MVVVVLNSQPINADFNSHDCEMSGRVSQCNRAPFIHQLRGVTELTPSEQSSVARVYRAAEGGERACNSRTSCIEGEMLAVTKFKSKSDTLIRVMTSIMPYKA